MEQVAAIARSGNVALSVKEVAPFVTAAVALVIRTARGSTYQICLVAAD